MTAEWDHPPRHLGRIRGAASARERLMALARSARELAERPHRERAPLASATAGDSDGVPFSAFELRAGVAAAELVSELAAIGDLPGCEPADLPDAVAALESASVPAWRGPASGRVRILSPYRARAARVKALFVASLQDGEFPSSGSADPLLSEERRRELGHSDLRRADPADQERYLFFACVSRPTDRLYLSWQNCDEDGGALARSPFADEVLDLLSPEPPIRSRGPERAVPAPDEATSARMLARALAVAGWEGDRDGALARLEVGEGWSDRVRRLFSDIPDPRALPGPLKVAAVLDELGSREVFSANSLEGWVECPYRWFVDHELAPQRLEPEADPLWLGGIVHRALELLYREAPGEDSIPRPADVGRWKRRFAELLDAEAESRTTLNHSQRAALDRLRVQVEAFLDTEAESESPFRPSVLELGFGPMDAEGEEDELRDALAIGDVTLRGRIDRIDVAPDGQSAIVRDYKTGKNVPTAAELADRGKLQIQLYMRVAQRVMGLDPVAGLYQPLGASATGKRKARGLALRGDERLDGVDIVSNDRRDADELEAALDAAEETAAAATRGMRQGLIDRQPIGGQCPKYCTFQPICRLERALGAVGESAGNGEREQ
jgi:RecB family exonuclease